MAEQEQPAQVVIAGAGPGGLTLALLLHRQGVDCVVLDKSPRDQLLARARAGFLERRTVQLLDRLGLGKRMRAEGLAHTACEIRRDGENVLLDYSVLCQDAPSYVYPQQEVVADLLAAYTAEGGRMLLGTRVTEVSAADSGSPVLHCADGTAIAAGVVVDAAGRHGPVASRLPAHACTDIEVPHGVRLLGVLAAAPPSAPHTVYGQHPHGFAGHMLRSPDMTRMYLEVAPGETVNDWPDARIRHELDVRLAAPGQSLRHGPVVERSIVEMHTRVVEPMAYGRVALLGDAAHIVPPSGGKGMNLAMADAAELATALGEHFMGNTSEADADASDGEWGVVGILAGWSRRRLADVWQVQEFSHEMLTLLHDNNPRAPGARYRDRLRSARLRRLRDDPHTRRAFLERYAGPPAARIPAAAFG